MNQPYGSVESHRFCCSSVLPSPLTFDIFASSLSFDYFVGYCCSFSNVAVGSILSKYLGGGNKMHLVFDRSSGRYTWDENTIKVSIESFHFKHKRIYTLTHFVNHIVSIKTMIVTMKTTWTLIYQTHAMNIHRMKLLTDVISEITTLWIQYHHPAIPYHNNKNPIEL
jgi:hypothetical protein